MNFKNIEEMAKYIETNTDKMVVFKKDFISSETKKHFIFTPEGKAMLNGKGYFNRLDIRNKINIAFKGYDTNKGDDISKIYNMIQNIISNL